MKAYLAILISLFVGLWGLYGEPFRTTAETDWESRTVRLKIEVDITDYGNVVPLAKQKAEQLIQRNLLDLFKHAVAPIRVRSGKTIADLLATDVSLISKLDQVSKTGTILRSVISRDTSSLVMEFTYPLHPNIISIFPLPVGREKLPLRMNWAPTREFSGVVIYAAEPLPVRGEEGLHHLQPALFPRIFDENLQTVLKAENQPDSVIHSSGVLQYGYGLNLERFDHIVGDDPLIIRAKEIFGIYHTDIIIADSDAEKILHSEHNRLLLEEGKIVVLLK